MKHIITGGNGFLGTRLAETLVERGERVLVLDIDPHNTWDDSPVEFMELDIRDAEALASVPIDDDDVVYHMAAKLLMPILPRRQRHAHFFSHLYDGTKAVLEHLHANTGCRKMIYFTTDMVYGHTLENPRTEDHPRAPLGPYGEAKYQTELLVEEFRPKGFNITLFRPRLIIGPGRVGILGTLFRLIELNLPVPLIGNGRNHYQFIAVQDCVDISLAAVEKGNPNTVFNVGSLNPPSVRELLQDTIEDAGSRSILIPTPAPAVKFVLDKLDRVGTPLLDPEQYLIADETCVLAMDKAQAELDWEPKFDDMDMLREAYRSWKAAK